MKKFFKIALLACAGFLILCAIIGITSNHTTPTEGENQSQSPKAAQESEGKPGPVETSKPIDKRSSLVVKGFYIGMSIEEAVKVAEKLTQSLTDHQSFLNSEGKFTPGVTWDFGMTDFVENRFPFIDDIYFRDYKGNPIRLRVYSPEDPRKIASYNMSDKLLFYFDYIDGGEVVGIGIGVPILNVSDTITYEEYSKMVVKAYKLILVDPKAVFEANKDFSESKIQNRWVCDLNIGVTVRVGQRALLNLRKIASKAEIDSLTREKEKEKREKNKATENSLN